MERRQIEGLIAFILLLWSCVNCKFIEDGHKGLYGFFPFLIGAGIQAVLAMLMAFS